MNKSILFVVIVATLSMSSLVFAQRPGGGGRGGQGFQGGGQRGGQPPVSPLMTALDVDKDGTLSAEEIAGAATALKALDKNADGVLDVSEMAPTRGGRGGGQGGQGGQGGGGRGGDPTERINQMMQLDTDGNGEISKEEGGERMARFFSFLDGDGNGSLTREEIETAMKNRGGRGGAGRGGAGGRGQGGGGGAGGKTERPAFEE